MLLVTPLRSGGHRREAGASSGHVQVSAHSASQLHHDAPVMNSLPKPPSWVVISP